MTLYLHIGLNKTGTSSLQRFCHQHRQVLRENGLEYPEVGIHDSAHYGVSKRLIGLPADQNVALADGFEEELRAAIASGRNLLVSSEYFLLASDKQVGQVRAFLSGFDIECRIIVYLRRHDRWIPSLFNQALKTSPKHPLWHSDIREYALHLLGSREFDVRYPVILDRWAVHFGRASMIVRPFETMQFRDGEFLWDVLGNINVDLPPLLVRQGLIPVRVNESIPEHLLRAIAYIKAAGIDKKTTAAITSLLIRSASQEDVSKTPRQSWDDRSFTLPSYLRESIVNLFADDYRYIAEHYVGSKDSVLFREPIS